MNKFLLMMNRCLKRLFHWLIFAVLTFFSIDVWAQSAGSASALMDLEANLFGLLISAFGIGLLLTFTPCVLPLVPIVFAIIAGQGNAANSRVRGGILSIIYVLGTVATYAAIGAVAGATGDQLQAYFQTPLVLALLAAVLVAGALSMFGLYELKLPTKFETRIQTTAARIQGRSVGAVFVLGLVSALVIGACVTPLLISVLGVVIAKGDPVLGAVMMSSMALGMGALLIAIGFGLSFLLPKTGAWMERIKHLLGVALIAVAIYLLGSIPEVPVLFLWAALFIVSAVYLGTITKMSAQPAGLQKLSKGTGIALFVWGIVSLTGSSLGNRDVLNPLPQLTDLVNRNDSSNLTMTGIEQESVFVYVRNMIEFDEKLGEAKTDNRVVMVDFYADWCLDCKRMDRTTFRDPAVIAHLNEKVSSLKIDVTDPKDEFGRAVRKRFGVFGPPAIVLLDAQGNLRPDLLTYGYLDVEEFFDLLAKI